MKKEKVSIDRFLMQVNIIFFTQLKFYLLSLYNWRKQIHSLLWNKSKLFMLNILPHRDALGTVAIGVIEGEVNDAQLLIFASALNYESELPVFHALPSALWWSNQCSIKRWSGMRTDPTQYVIFINLLKIILHGIP